MNETGKTNMRVEAAMIILALLLLLAIVCAYSWVAYRIKTSNPIKPTVPKPIKIDRGSSNLDDK